MEHLELVVLFLLVAVVALTVLARTIGVPYPILLVVGGSALGFVPGVPAVELDPELVLLIFLPPLLFHGAFFASARALREHARAISLSAVGLVLLTILVVAVVLHAAVPSLPWPVAFAFGAIVSPTDPLAAIAIARNLGVPRRVITVIEGESLINDGTALVSYATAVAVALGGSFSVAGAGGDFVIDVLGGLAVGVAATPLLGWAARRIDDDVLSVTVTLIAGYAAYLPAEQLGVSGVIAAVTTGLLLGQRHAEYSTAATRLLGFAFWDVLVFLLNAVLFVLVGLQLPGVLETQDRRAAELVALGALASAAVILTRLGWVLTIPHVIRALDRRPAQLARRVGWRQRFVVGWAGLRGAVSLAAALALPEQIAERDLLLWLTLCVIFATLVLQGLTLPALIRRLGVEADGEEQRELLIARKAAARAAIGRVELLAEQEWTRDDTVNRLRGLYEFRYRRHAQHFRARDGDEEDLEARSALFQRMMREILAAQRTELARLRDIGTISDEARHVVLRELDLEEERLDLPL